MSQNNELRQACEAWLQAALRLLRTVPIPYEQDYEVTFHANGYQAKGKQKINTVEVYILYNKALFTLPECERVTETISKTLTPASVLSVDRVGTVHSEPEQLGSVHGWHLGAFLTEYLNANGNLSFSDQIYDRIYDALERYIYTIEPFDGVWSVHLRNLSSDIDTIQIDKGIYLRRATHEEKVDAVRKASHPRLHITPDVPEFFLDIHEPIDRTTMNKSGINPQEAMSIAQKVVLALRLLKSHLVGIASYRWQIPDQPFVIYNGLSYPIPLRHFDFKGEPYHLTQEDADALPKLWRKSKKAYGKSELATVITRYEDSYTRVKPEDKLIDYWIGLEALFFALIDKEYVGNMGETVASTISYYLGNTADERRSIYTAIIASHKARGHFVHGQRGKPIENLDLVVKKTEKYLRMALRKRIEEFED